MRTPLEESWLAKEEAGEKIPLAIRSGVKPGYPQDPGSAMFSQGNLWYGLTPNKPDLLVTAREMPIANKNASIMSNKASLKQLEAQGTRRVTNDNIYTQGPHNRQNTTAYIWKPGYGYQKLVQEPGLTSLKFFERPSKIDLATKLGLTKHERTNLDRFQKEALEDLEQYVNSGQYRQYPIFDQNGNIIWQYETNSESLSKLMNDHAIPYKGAYINGFGISNRNFPLNISIGEKKLMEDKL